ncbi:MAG: DUF308 domain-containing protein [Spirochaetaceae bacterium]|nr:DUF308 domain-containing protein [Spirochaetaceae bacterium]
MKKIDWTSLLVGVILIIGGIFALANPEGTVLTLAGMLGIVAILQGLSLVVSYFRIKEHTGFKVKLNAVFGLILIVVGLVFLFRPASATAVFTYFMAAWFIVDAIRNLVSTKPLKNLGNGVYWTSIVLNLLVLVGGIILLFDPQLAGLAVAVVIGFPMLFSGIRSVIFAIFSKVEA